MATLAEKLAEHGIRLRSYSEGSVKTTCPQCSASRKKKTDPCLSVTINEAGALWNCWHCGFAGGVSDREETTPTKTRATRGKTEPRIPLVAELDDAMADWFASRGISEETRRIAGVGRAQTMIPGVEGKVWAVAFPYRALDGKVVNVKFRTLDKHFAQVKGGDKRLWLLDLANPADGALVVCEGEMDALALLEAGVPNGVSVPDGAPKEAKDGPVDPANDRKFEYLWACKSETDEFQRIILATDGDGPGQALAEELARRLGRDRCWTAHWPDGCKDANDVLLRHGPDEVRRCIADAQPSPIKSLVRADAYRDDVFRIYRHGHKRGFATHLAPLDELYSVVPGQWTVVTGIPGSGKSELIDQVLVNLAQFDGWRFAVCSFENSVEDHIAKLAEKFLELPFWDGPRMRMTEEQVGKAIEWIRHRFVFIRAEGDDGLSLDNILEAARGAVARHGVRGLVIDPWNEVEHQRPAELSETEYVSRSLSKVRRFAQAHGAHVWLVAHPAKLHRENGKIPVPTLYDISGSAHFSNKADAGLVVHRPDPKAPITEVYVRKVRFKWVGKVGMAEIAYDPPTGRYFEIRPPEAAMPNLV